MRLLAFSLALSVCLATFLGLLSTVLNQGVEVGSVEIISGSQVIVYLSPQLDAEASAMAAKDLGGVFGVGQVRPATSEDIAATKAGYEVGSDIGHVRTLVLDGRAPQTAVVVAVQRVLRCGFSRCRVGGKDWLDGRTAEDCCSLAHRGVLGRRIGACCESRPDSGSVPA